MECRDALADTYLQFPIPMRGNEILWTAHWSSSVARFQSP